MKDLRSGIEHLKQAKAHMSKANGIMSDHISKLKALEEENAALKAELDDWKGNAEGFQPDAYMKLPLDADGVPIRIGDTVWFGDKKSIVTDITLSCEGWDICADSDGYGFGGAAPETLSHKQPEPADSWEKLDEDAKKTICEIAGQAGSPNCVGCKWERTSGSCQERARLEILKRAKKLAGIEEEAER